MASCSGSTKVCFNSTCKAALEVPRQGWLCRTGDFADLCDRCASAFKDGNFCDKYHLNASGWRSCESCGKQVHCGCIVSFHMFILLDAGGIECLNCAKPEYLLTPNPTWPSASPFLPGPAERIRDISSKNWRSIAGPSPEPWRQPPYLMTASKPQPQLQSKTPFLADILSSIDNPLAIEQLNSCSLGKSTTVDHSERVKNENWRVCASEMIGDRARTASVQYDGKRNLFGDISYQSFFNANGLATPLSTLAATFVAQDQKGEELKASGSHVQRLCPLTSVGKHYNGSGPSVRPQTHNAKARNETQGRHQPLPRYWPRITDQELQQISGSANSRITPLFEKVLSASDAGRIGRLVLPKKCAEAYLPPISQPEGYPLVVQDLKGKDWVVQFRYWPNNNSRMYVLEGVTPCIQSMQLQAGDTVTFSRLEPDGKLIMGFRKAPLASPAYQGNETTSTHTCTHEEPLKGRTAFKPKNPESAQSEGDKVSIGSKRKKGKLCSESKYVKPNDGKILKLNVTLEQLQGLLRPPLTNAPTVMIIEGVEFEDFQESPVIGSPTICSTNHVKSLCAPDVESMPEHLEYMPLMINHVSVKENKSENPESVETMEGLDELVDLSVQDGRAIAGSSQPTTTHSGHKHNSTCTCNVCLALKHSMQMMHHDQKHSEKETGDSVRNPSRFMYADILQYNQVGNRNQNHKKGPNESFEDDQNGENPNNPSFKSQNIDLNIQPEREEEACPVSEFTGMMRLAQESIHRSQKLSQ